MLGMHGKLRYPKEHKDSKNIRKMSYWRLKAIFLIRFFLIYFIIYIFNRNRDKIASEAGFSTVVEVQANMNAGTLPHFLPL